MKIVFYGTPEFAVKSLDAILGSSHSVLAVVTAPDKESGRGKKISYSAVKEYAIQHHLTLFQPTNLKDEQFLDSIRALEPDIQVVVAFRMIPEALFTIPKLGTINLHASLLPNYRGAAPINHAIINNEKKTGVTTFYINRTIDTGDILLQKSVDISFTENAGELHDRLKVVGAELLVETLHKLETDSLKPIIQDSLSTVDIINLKKAPKIDTEFCRIQWTNTCLDIYNHIRGLSPYPGAQTTMHTQSVTMRLKIYKSYPTSGSSQGVKAGRMIPLSKSKLGIACSDCILEILELKPEGKKTMTAADFMNGYFVDDSFFVE